MNAAARKMAVSSSNGAAYVFESVGYCSSGFENMYNYQQNKMFCDVTVRVGREEYSAHRVVLAAGSPYFADVLHGFGTPSRATTTTAPGFGGFGTSFGTPAATTPAFGTQFGQQATNTTPAFGTSFATPATAAPAFGTSFGTPATAAPAFGTNFGTPALATQAFGTSYGTPNQTAATPSLFGSAQTPKPSLFGTPAPTGNLFSTPANTGGLFGSTGAQQAPSLFGPAVTTTTPNLFRNSVGTTTTASGGLFGGTSSFGTAGSNFGGGGGLFGATATTSAAPGTSFRGFGTETGVSTGGAGFGLFGSGTGSNLFGNTLGQKPAVAPGGYSMSECEVYNPETNTWHEIASMQKKRHWHAVIGLGQLMYAFGGLDGNQKLSSAEYYDPGKDAWTFTTPLPHERFGHAICSLNGAVFICGGQHKNGHILSTVEQFDVSTAQYKTCAAMNTRRCSFKTASIGDCIYAIGGWGDQSPYSVERFDPREGRWFPAPSMITNRSFHGVTVLNDYIYCTGGDETETSGERFDICKNAWEPIPEMLTESMGHELVTLDGCVYAVGGFGNSVEKFHPNTNRWVEMPSMLKWRDWVAAHVLNCLEIQHL